MSGQGTTPNPQPPALDGGGLTTPPAQSTRPCGAHLEHRPRCGSTDLHHVIPKAWGGSDNPTNIIPICPTGHRNIHQLLLAYQRAGGTPTWDIRQRFHPAERELAHRAWEGRPQPAAGAHSEPSNTEGGNHARAD